MGVTGLLQHLKEAQEEKSLRQFAGKTLAVDTYGWLHRGLVSCAEELCQNIPTRKYINSVMKKIDMLLHFGVEPFLVFDGAYLPTKADTDKERRLKREEASRRAQEFTKKGNRKLAWKEYMKAAGVTPEMAKSIMVELDSRKIKYVVAPYEADPQMVYLEKIGLVDGILSEDSDLLIFGCQKLITKLNECGECIEIDRRNFSKVSKIPQLENYSDSQLRVVAMLSGCDYTKGIPGVGLKTAFSLVKKHQNIERILNALRSEGKTIPPDFLDELTKADLAFQFQKVFNPQTQLLCTLNEYPDSLLVEFEFLESCCGRTYEDHIHAQICNGKIHPNNHSILVSREQNLAATRSSSLRLYSSSNNKQQSVGHNAELTQNSYATRSIDSYFSNSRKHETNSLKNALNNDSKRETLVRNNSPTKRKLRLLGLSDAKNKDSSTIINRSSYFTTVKTKEKPNLDSDTSSMFELSDPVEAETMQGVAAENMNSPKKQCNESYISVKEKQEFSQNKRKKTEEVILESLEFGIEENLDDIQESPVKTKTQNLHSIALDLRKRFSHCSEDAGSELCTRKRIFTPLKEKNPNIPQYGKPQKQDRKQNLECNTKPEINTTTSIKLSSFAFQG